jgi:hypothetical protein
MLKVSNTKKYFYVTYIFIYLVLVMRLRYSILESMQLLFFSILSEDGSLIRKIIWELIPSVPSAYN